MKRLLLILLLLCPLVASAGPIFTQPNPPSLAADPSTCSTSGAWYQKFYYNTTSKVWKYCSATNTWTAFGTSTFSPTITSATTGDVISYSGSAWVNAQPGFATSRTVADAVATYTTTDRNKRVIRTLTTPQTDVVPAISASYPDGFLFEIINSGSATVTLSGGYTGSVYVGETARMRSNGTTWEKSSQYSGTLPVARLPVATATVAGAVPTPPNNTTTFLRGDATWAAAGGGSIPLFTYCGGTVGTGNGTWYVMPTGNTANTIACSIATTSAAYPTFPVAATASRLCATVQTACTTGLDVSLWSGATVGTMAESTLTVNMTTTAANTKVCDTTHSVALNLDDYWAIEIRPKQATETCKGVSVSFKVQ